jgi:hypothetical protein
MNAEGGGEPCRVERCQWGSSGTAGGWKMPICLPGPTGFPPDYRRGCMYRWLTDEDGDGALAPYDTWARAEMDAATLAGDGS